jgi:hypothetical protein
MPPANFVETLEEKKLKFRGGLVPKAEATHPSFICEKPTLTPTSAGLLSDHEDGSEMFLRNVMLSLHIPGGARGN